MYSIEFYKDKDGNEPVKEYISSLAGKNDKDSRVNLNKIRDYIKTLSEYGTRAGEPYVKHIEGEIWEDGNKIILLSHFIKKTQKTPQREIDKAKRLMKDHKERSSGDEKK